MTENLRYPNLKLCSHCDKVLSVAEEIETFCEHCERDPRPVIAEEAPADA